MRSVQQLELFEEVKRLARAGDVLARRGWHEESRELYKRALAALGAPAPSEPAATTDDFRRGIAVAARRRFGELLFVTVRSRRRAITAAVVLVVLACSASLAVAWSGPRDIGVGARWTASSAYRETPKSGNLSRFARFDHRPEYFVHTDSENNPHVDIDLAKVRVVSGVDIENATHCCLDRAKGLEVLVSIDGSKFRRVAKADDRSFRSWSVRFTAARARYVRFALTHKDYLHLSAVRIFGK